MDGQDLSAEDLFGEALELPTKARADFLREACRDAPELRREVEQLLSSFYQMGDFLGGSGGSKRRAREDGTAATLATPKVVAGSQVGRYVVERPIGAGGMGEVFRALDTKLNRTVALKLLLFGQGADGPLAQRFLNEARLASSLNHPNIVALYGDGAGMTEMEVAGRKRR